MRDIIQENFALIWLGIILFGLLFFAGCTTTADSYFKSKVPAVTTTSKQ